MRVAPPLLLLCAVVTWSPWSHAVPRSARVPALGATLELMEVDVLGGAVEAGLYVMDVTADVPGVVNGVLSASPADLKMRLNLKARAVGAAGLNAVDAFVPYQDVRVRIENLSVAGDDRVVEFPLLPTVGLQSGWSYSSHVLLPPVNLPRNPLGDQFRITVTAVPGPVAVAHASLPASPAWVSAQRWTVLDGQVRIGDPTVVPVGPAQAARSYVTARDQLYAQYLAQDRVTAVTTYQGRLRPLVQQAMDVTRYPSGSGFTTANLADLDLAITRALQHQALGDDCGPANPAECMRILERQLSRVFTLAAIQAMHAAVANLDAAAWDDAAVYALEALREGSVSMESLCLAGPPGAPSLGACALVTPLETALLSGAAAVLRRDGAALQVAQQSVYAALIKRAAYDWARFVWRSLQTSDTAQFNVERAAARAALFTLAHLLSTQDLSILEAALENRVLANFSAQDASELVARLNTALVPAVLTASDMCSPTEFAGVQP